MRYVLTRENLVMPVMESDEVARRHVLLVMAEGKSPIHHKALFELSNKLVLVATVMALEKSLKQCVKAVMVKNEK